MHNLLRPVRTIKNACIDITELKISEVADKLKVSREFLIKLINNRTFRTKAIFDAE